MSDIRGSNPALLIAGGRPINETAVKSVLAAELKNFEKPKVAYIGAANGDSAGFFETMRTFLLQAGASEVNFVRLAGGDTDTDAAVKTLSCADAVFLSGGEVEDGIKHIDRHGLAGLLRNLYGAGKKFIGISAGAIMLGDCWVRWDTPGDDDTAELFKCLGIIPHIFDTHAEDEDWIELKTALKLMGDDSTGIGIPRGGVIRAGCDGKIANLIDEYLTFTYMNKNFLMT